MFTDSEARTLLESAESPLNAMILLGLNADLATTTVVFSNSVMLNSTEVGII
jgi:hypothetical protein